MALPGERFSGTAHVRSALDEINVRQTQFAGTDLLVDGYTYLRVCAVAKADSVTR